MLEARLRFIEELIDVFNFGSSIRSSSRVTKGKGPNPLFQRIRPHLLGASPLALGQASQFLNRFDHCRLRTFLTLAGDERHALVLFQRFMPATLNFGVMSEEVLTALLRHDKAEALVVVEPLHNTSFNLQCKS